jgi:nucleoid DNA-binding protein
MIKEIQNPLPSIFDIVEHNRLINRLKKKTKTKLGIYDVAFTSDFTLVEDFANKCDINKDEALSFLTVFFEEIKKELMSGGIINICGFGRFYINGPHKGNKGKVILPSKNARISPKFKPSVTLKKKLKNS